MQLAEIDTDEFAVDGGLAEFEIHCRQGAELSHIVRPPDYITAEQLPPEQTPTGVGRIALRLQELLQHYSLVIPPPKFPTYKPQVYWENIGKTLDNMYLSDDVLLGMLQLSVLETEMDACILNCFFYVDLARIDSREDKIQKCHRYHKGVRRAVKIKKEETGKEVNLQKSLFLCPQHLHGCHWTVLIVDLAKEILIYYDPLGEWHIICTVSIF